MKREKIYIGDLAYKEAGSAFPLGAGYMASMISFYFKKSIETKIFRDPEKLVKAIKEDPPNIVALANYSWNRNINSQVINYSKKISKNIISIFGGPCFAKNDKQWLDQFFKKNDSLDFYISGEGEWKFIQLIKQARKYSYSVKKIRDKVSPDVFFKTEAGEITQGTIPLHEVLDHRYEDTIKKNSNLDIIQSPYLSGQLDEFFEIDDMVPMIETVRGCPYACTFCCWGDPSLSRLSAFSEERVYAELDYIVKRSKKNFGKLILADGNFGILKRDVELAKYLNKLNSKYGWPKNIYLYFAKNSNDRIVEIASLLGKMVKISLARQTENEDVLKNIKRKNINEETFHKIQKQLAASNIDSMVEFIYPLPGETRETFMEGMNNLFKKIDIMHTEIRFYPTELLPGSEMATIESRKKFDIKTAYRKIHGFNKNFGDVSGCEYQEIIISTNTFSFLDYIYVRKLHYFICLFATYSIYGPIVDLYLSKKREHSFIWVIKKLIDAMEGQLKNKETNAYLLIKLFKKITTEVTNELTLEKEFNENKNSMLFQGGTTKRINIFYIITLLYGEEGKYRKAFSQLIRNIFLDNSLCNANEIDRNLALIENNIIDYNKIKQTLKPNKLEEEVANISNSLIASEFIKCNNGNLIDTLDKMQDLSTGGHLNTLVLKNYNNSQSKLTLEKTYS